MSSLTTSTGVELTDGMIVQLARFPGTNWIVHNGWYVYQGVSYMGWYFCSIPANTILPVNEEDLQLLTVVSSSSSSTCAPSPSTSPPSYSKPSVQPNDHDLLHMVEKAWITVETLEERNRLNIKLVPNGKIVRVNNVDGEVKYYCYNQATSTWEETAFGGSLSEEYITKDEVQETIDNAINTAVSNIDVTDLVKETTESIFQETVSEMVNTAVSEINEQVNSLVETVNDIPEWIAL